MPKFNPGDRIRHTAGSEKWVVDACWDDLMVVHRDCDPLQTHHSLYGSLDRWELAPVLTEHAFKTERKVPQEGDKIMMVVTAGPNHTEPQDVIVEFTQ